MYKLYANKKELKEQWIKEEEERLLKLKTLQIKAKYK